MIDRPGPFITIVMPVLNEERFIAGILRELVEQNYPPEQYEVIVADGGSKDRTRDIIREMAQKHPQLILKDNPGRFPSSGRNVGFKNGRGEIFLVIDGHCEVRTRQLLQNTVSCFERSGAHCLGRPQPFIIPDKPSTQRAIGLARSSWLGHSSKSFIHAKEEGFVSPVSVGCAYKRQVFEKIGYVDEAFDACEDVEFNYRVQKAGLTTFFSPSIAVHYHPRESFSALWRQLSRYGRGRVLFMCKHPETADPDMLLPALFAGCLALGPFTLFLSSILGWSYFLCVALYGFLLCWESSRLAGKGPAPLSSSLLSIAAFLIIHMSLGFSILKEISAKPKMIGAFLNNFRGRNQPSL